MSASHYVYPFTCVVVSPHTSSTITGAALSSLHKFLLYGFLRRDSLAAKEGIEMIGDAIINCKFEEVSEGEGEVVLMKLLELSGLCIRCDVGDFLSEDLIFKIFMVCYEVAVSSSNFEMSSEERKKKNVSNDIDNGNGKGGNKKNVSALLSTTAANSLAHICLCLFNRSKNDSLMASGDDEDGDDDVLNWGGEENGVGVGVGGGGGNKNAKLEQFVDSEASAKAEANFAVVRIMQHLSTLTNPRQNSDQTCTLALSLINIALETSTTHLSRYATLIPIMQDDLCKHLLQLSQAEELTILSLTLRVVFNLFNSMKDLLKVQLEVFLTSVHLRILSNAHKNSSEFERRELALESLLEFCQEPALMQDLYTNYDCDMQVSE